MNQAHDYLASRVADTEEKGASNKFEVLAKQTKKMKFVIKAEETFQMPHCFIAASYSMNT